MIQQYKNGTNYVVVLNRGDELIASLTTFAQQNNLQNLWLQSGLGGAMDATLGTYDGTSQQYNWSHFKGAYEIANVQGNMTILNGEPFWHVHSTLGGPDLTAVAGHVKTMTIGLTCELFVTVLETPMQRAHDETTGLRLLEPAQSSPMAR